MNFPKLPISDIADYNTQKSFQMVQDWIKNNSPLSGFSFVELTFPAAVSAFKYAHNLGFTPKDVIISSTLGVGAVTFNYADFDRTNLSITTTGQCVVRFFVGTYGGTA